MLGLSVAQVCFRLISYLLNDNFNCRRSSRESVLSTWCDENSIIMDSKWKLFYYKTWCLTWMQCVFCFCVCKLLYPRWFSMMPLISLMRPHKVKTQCSRWLSRLEGCVLQKNWGLWGGYPFKYSSGFIDSFVDWILVIFYNYLDIFNFPPFFSFFSLLRFSFSFSFFLKMIGGGHPLAAPCAAQTCFVF